MPSLHKIQEREWNEGMSDTQWLGLSLADHRRNKIAKEMHLGHKEAEPEGDGVH